MVEVGRIAGVAAATVLGLWSAMAMASPAKPKPVALETVVPAQPEPPPQPRVYLFRGAMGPLFSTGIDRLGEKLTQAGLGADVYEFTICRIVAARALASYRENPAPIVLIGHSMGGLCSIVFADMANQENIPISLVITIDPAQATGKVPLNVERFINVFLSDSVLGGGDVVTASGYRGHYASFDLRQNKRVTHVNIEKSDDLHRQIVESVLKLSGVSVQTQVDAVPLRYVVPANALVELWDSGVRLPVRAGDTLASIAAVHHVPVWSIAQINALPEDAPLTVGQAIVVPRHLQPVDAASSARR